MKTKLAILLLLAIAVSACKTKEVPGRVRAPRHCNTCTKWSHVPETESENTLLASDEA